PTGKFVSKSGAIRTCRPPVINLRRARKAAQRSGGVSPPPGAGTSGAPLRHGPLQIPGVTDAGACRYIAGTYSDGSGPADGKVAAHRGCPGDGRGTQSRTR